MLNHLQTLSTLLLAGLLPLDNIHKSVVAVVYLPLFLILRDDLFLPSFGVELGQVLRDIGQGVQGTVLMADDWQGAGHVEDGLSAVLDLMQKLAATGLQSGRGYIFEQEGCVQAIQYRADRVIDPVVLEVRVLYLLQVDVDQQIHLAGYRAHQRQKTFVVVVLDPLIRQTCEHDWLLVALVTEILDDFDGEPQTVRV